MTYGKTRLRFASFELEMDIIDHTDGYETWQPAEINNVCFKLGDEWLSLDNYQLHGVKLADHLTEKYIEHIAARAK